jgi:hypothetical protein
MATVSIWHWAMLAVPIVILVMAVRMIVTRMKK